MDMDDHYPPQQEGTNIYSITPEQLALHIKQQEQQMQNPAHYIYYTPQQQQYLQQQELLKYRLEAIQNPELNGHHKHKKLEESTKKQMQPEKQAPIKPKIKVNQMIMLYSCYFRGAIGYYGHFL